MKAPQDCQDMVDIRVEVDRLDEALIELFAQRTAYIDCAAAIKGLQDLPARIDARVEQVIENIRRHAADRGLPADQFETMWRSLVDWSIAREEAQLGKDEDHDR